MPRKKPRPPILLNQKSAEEKAAQRRFRERISRDQEELSHLIAEASRLMDRCRISHSIKQVPDWMLPFASYSLKRGLRYLNYPNSCANEDFYEAIVAGFKGDLTTVEMWILAHEYD